MAEHWGNTELSNPPEDGTKAMPVGLAKNNPESIPFQCGTCMYFHEGTCQNEHPKLHGKFVEAEWCCNLFDRDGMEVVVNG